MEEWFKLSEEDRRIAINQVSSKTGLLPVAVEKDLWVTNITQKILILF